MPISIGTVISHSSQIVRKPGFVPSDVPQAEVDALTWLYNNGGGISWTNATNWLSDPVVGNWYGVTVAGGHVTQLDLNNNGGSGNIGAWAIDDLPSLTILRLHKNSFSGDLGGWTLPASLADLWLYNNSFSGDLSGWTLPAPLTILRLDNNSFSGDLSGWTLPASLTILRLHSNSFSGDLSGWTLPASLTILRLYNNSFSGAPNTGSNTTMQDYQYQDNALIQADVDAVLLSIYNRRMAFTYATPSLTIDGTNAAPSGVYQAQCPPTTGNEYKYELVNDSCGDGFNTWTITSN
jgi:hypothetical protein